MLAALAAADRSASSQTIIGSEPPSSSVTRLAPRAASAAIRSPVGVEPVKATLRTSGCVTNASPATGPVPGTTFSTPGGTPASVRISARRNVVNGVGSAALATQGLPGVSGGRETTRRGGGGSTRERRGEHQPDADLAPDGTLHGGTPPGMTGDDVEGRAELATFIGKGGYPTGRELSINLVIHGSAPDRVIDHVRRLPAGREFHNVNEVWTTLG